MVVLPVASETQSALLRSGAQRVKPRNDFVVGSLFCRGLFLRCSAGFLYKSTSMQTLSLSSRALAFARPLPVALYIAVSLLGGSASAAVRLPAVVGHNMVLQRDMAVPIWGWADPGESVTVRIAGQEATCVAGPDGRWHVRLEPMAAGGPHTLSVSGKTAVTIRNVLVGEVWLCSGQSNMAMSLRACAGGKSAAAKASHPRLRLLTVPITSSCRPLDNMSGAWSECTPDRAAVFSGLGYFFGRRLQEHLDVPVGLIGSYVGGTPVEAWTPEPAFYTKPDLRALLDDWSLGMAKYIDRSRAVQQQLDAWQTAAANVRREGLRFPPVPFPLPNDPRASMPSRLYNGMISPVRPFGIRGVIWYQGEANVARGLQYRNLFRALIGGWRDAWDQGDVPFLFVQLSAFTAANDDPVPASGWAEVREAQAQALALPRTAMAVTIDVGDADDIHPKRKREVADRLVLAARAIAYGEDVVYSGPVYRDMKREGSKAHLFFSRVGSGLQARGGALRRFEVAGPDARYTWARAVIEDDHVTVWSDEVSDPVAVRYAWSGNPEGANLYNADGLPASPFRTSDTFKAPLPRTTHRTVCRPAAAPPRIDGVLDDATWQDTEPLGRLRIIESYSFSKYPTEVRLAYDKDNLYVAFRCTEPNPAGLVANAARRDGAVWDDDSVEIFLDPALEGDPYYQHAVNAAGVIFDTRNRWGSDWNGQCATATARGKDHWIAELSIPWTSMGLDPPQPGDRMGLQIARTRVQPKYEISQWAPTQGPSNHRPSHFGLLVFE